MATLQATVSYCWWKKSGVDQLRLVFQKDIIVIRKKTWDTIIKNELNKKRAGHQNVPGPINSGNKHFPGSPKGSLFGREMRPPISGKVGEMFYGQMDGETHKFWMIWFGTHLANGQPF